MQHSPLAGIRLAEDGPTVLAWPDRFQVFRGAAGDAVGRFENLKNSDDLVCRQLLSGCLAAALPATVSNGQRSPDTSADQDQQKLRDHVFGQCVNHEAMRHTASALERARKRFEAIGDTVSAGFCAHIAAEEAGHDKLALLDLEAMGLPGSELVARFVPRHPQRVVQLLVDYSKQDSPFGIFGYGYAVERLSLQISKEMVEAVRSLAPPGVEIARCLKVHSNAGAEVEHVQDMVKFVAQLDIGAKRRVCEAVFRTVQTIMDDRTHREDRLALDALLDSWNWEPFVGVQQEQLTVGQSFQ